MRIPPPEIPAVVTLIELSRSYLSAFYYVYINLNILTIMYFIFVLNESLPIRNFISGKSLSVSFICL